MKKKITIIPDVHGRLFWKYAVDNRDESKVIFLGDYLDPYFEKGLAKDSIQNLKDIIQFKKDNPEDVVLLIGNHDRHYMDDCHLQYGRYSYGYQTIINKEKLFDNDLFDIAYEDEVNGKKFLFTHAGVARRWAEDWLELEEGQEYNAKMITDLYNETDGYDPKFGFDSIISHKRGGQCNYGSPIWNDILDMTKYDLSNYIQIFGHTQLKKDPINCNNKLYCLDCRRPFVIDEEGILREFNGDKIRCNYIDLCEK